MKKIVITGADGLIGSRIIELLKDKYQFVPISQKNCDITSQAQVKETFGNLDCEIILHLAAYTNVDQAEKQSELAYKVNVTGTENIFQICQYKNVKLIHISTDFVFDGQAKFFNEESQPNPISVYGKTKYQAEQIVKNKAMVVRLAYPYRTSFEAKKDFVRSIKSLLKEKKALRMVTDSIITPTFVDDIVYSLDYLMTNYSPEIFHIVGADSISPYQAGLMIAQKFGFDKSLIQEITYNEYFKNKAKRPKNGKITTIKNKFYQMKTFEEGLNFFLLGN